MVDSEVDECAKKRKLPDGWNDEARLEELITERTVELERLAEACTRELENEAPRPVLKIEVPKKEEKAKRPREENCVKLKLYKESKYTDKCPDFKGKANIAGKEWSVILWERKTKAGKECLSGRIVREGEKKLS